MDDFQVKYIKREKERSGMYVSHVMHALVRWEWEKADLEVEADASKTGIRM